MAFSLALAARWLGLGVMSCGVSGLVNRFRQVLCTVSVVLRSVQLVVMLSVSLSVSWSSLLLVGGPAELQLVNLFMVIVVKRR